MDRNMLVLALFLITSHAAAEDESEGGRVVPNHDGITAFEAEWDERDFDLAAYFEALPADAATWYQHVQTLSNPWLEGRQPGTRGDELAAEYITFYLDQAGLQPAFTDNDGPSWRQPFDFRLGGQPPIVNDAWLSIGNDRFDRGDDFTVLAPSGAADVRLPLSTAGYAIERGPNGATSFGEDDDFEGRAVLLLRYEPMDEDGQSRWSTTGFSPHAALRPKFKALADRGASAILLVNPMPHTSELATTQSSVGFSRPMGIPVLHVSQHTAEALLRKASGGDTGLSDIEQRANEGVSGALHFPAWRKVEIQTDLEHRPFVTMNVAGVLPGSGDLADEWVVVGGHYDHIGHGYTGSRAPGDDRVHPGADDNASGIATILVLADRLSQAADQGDADRRSLLFIGFSGEEAGLHGSAHFVEDPPIDLDRTNMMLNLDMMGRIRGRSVAMGGTGTAREFAEVLPKAAEPTGLTVMATPSGLGPSDHANFFRADVPVLFLFTGLHDHYHTPEDVAWRVNPEGTLRILDLCERILMEATHRPSAFTFVGSTEGTPARQTGSSVRLGIMPSYTTADEPGVQVDGVSEGTSAAEAGIREGDVIVAWNDESIEGGRDLMKHLRAHSPGDTVVIRVIRDGAPKDINVTLKGQGG